MIRNLSIILCSINLLFFTACGSSSAISLNEDNLSNKLSLEGIELYNANLKLVDGSRRYDVEKFDGITSNLTSFFFDFDAKSFAVHSEEKEVFVDGQRNAFSNIEYRLNTAGKLLATLNQKDIYSLELMRNEAIKSSEFDA